MSSTQSRLLGLRTIDTAPEFRATTPDPFDDHRRFDRECIPIRSTAGHDPSGDVGKAAGEPVEVPLVDDPQSAPGGRRGNV